MIIEGKVNGVEKIKFAHIVDRLAVVDGGLVEPVPGGVEPVLVLCPVPPPRQGVLKLYISDLNCKLRTKPTQLTLKKSVTMFLSGMTFL